MTLRIWGADPGTFALVIIFASALALQDLSHPRSRPGNPDKELRHASAPSGRIKLTIEGDSLSYRSLKGEVLTWSDELHASYGTRYPISFRATKGDRLAGQIKKQVKEITSEFDDKYSSNIVILFAGVNDLLTGLDGNQLYRAAVEVSDAYRAAGFRVWIATIPPALGADDGERERYNNLLRTTSSKWHKVIDFARLPQFDGSAEKITSDRTLYQEDRIHLTKMGHRLLFLEVDKNLSSLDRGV